jgi:hypothetical protein
MTLKERFEKEYLGFDAMDCHGIPTVVYVNWLESQIPQWISVDDRLPPDDKDFIACNMNQMGLRYIAWWDKIHELYKYTGGEYCGTKRYPNFTQMKYLAKDHCPHTMIVITSTNAEMYTGIMSTGEILDYLKD